MSENTIIEPTMDVDHVERQLLESASMRGFGPLAGSGALAIRWLRVRLDEMRSHRDAIAKEHDENVRALVALTGSAGASALLSATIAERDALATRCEQLEAALRRLAEGPSDDRHPSSYQACKVCGLLWCYGQDPRHRDNCLLKESE